MHSRAILQRITHVRSILNRDHNNTGIRVWKVRETRCTISRETASKHFPFSIEFRILVFKKSGRLDSQKLKGKLSIQKGAPSLNNHWRAPVH